MAEIKSPGGFAARRKAWSDAEPRTVVTHRDDVERIEFGGQGIAVLVSGDDTAGQMAVFEIAAQLGAGAPHTNRWRRTRTATSWKGGGRSDCTSSESLGHSARFS